jgi:hypothetical protein
MTKDATTVPADHNNATTTWAVGREGHFQNITALYKAHISNIYLAPLSDP